jgi:ABC-type Fe3+ transport system permease subunit
VFRLGRWRWPLATLTAVATAVLFGLPLGGLVWKAGLRYATAAQPGPPTWEAALVLERVAQEARDQRALLVDTAVLALTVGALTAGLALPLAWLARKSGRWEWGVWGLAAVLAAAPGPVLGVGLLDAFQLLFALPGGGLLKPLLYSRPSPLPNVWICTLRVGPLALAALWPRVRLVPRELEEVAALDGVGPAGFVARVLLRLLAGPVAWAALAAGVLAVGELSGGKLVTTPGYLPLAQHVFQMLHAGTDTSLAALCLLWLTLAAAGGAAAAWLAPRGGSR